MPEFKAKVVLELLEDGKTINELAYKYYILPKSIHQWKRQFFENASLAFENAIPAKKYKDAIEEKELKIDALSKALGQTTIERDWVLKNRIDKIYTIHPHYGYRRMHYALLEEG